MGRNQTEGVQRGKKIVAAEKILQFPISNMTFKVHTDVRDYKLVGVVSKEQIPV